jgi:DNA-binding LytR/AlgR family response regulator
MMGMALAARCTTEYSMIEADDTGTLLDVLMEELRLLRAENAAILQRMEDEAGVHKRVGVRVSAQKGDRLMLLKVPDIAFITTDTANDTLLVYGVDGQRYVNFESLDAVATRMADDPRVFRSHKSFLVNLNSIRAVDNDGGGRTLYLEGWGDDVTARVSSDHRIEFERRLGLKDA